VEAGLSERERAGKEVLFTRALRTLGDREDARAWWVPGRIEFLGKHTDYAGGPSLLCAVERGFAVVAAQRNDGRVSVRDAHSGERIETALKPEISVTRGHWSNYPLTVCRRVTRNFPAARCGVDIAFASDLPSAAGLSSSSALIVATLLALAEVNDLPSHAEYRESIRSSEDLAGYLGAVENGASFGTLAGDGGVGTRGGSEDHVAILRARAGALVQYSFAPIRFERLVPLPNDYVFVIAVSGIVAEKTGGALELYNRAARAAGDALRIWRERMRSTAPTLAAAVQESLTSDVAFAKLLEGDPALQARVSAFQEESMLVRAGGDALAEGDLATLGRVVEQSQRTAERLLGNQVPETIALAASARELGAAAASAFGAGFGGSVYALVPGAEVDDFRCRWAERYASAFPDRAAHFLVSGAGPPATKL
jgi:galactokinase